MTRLWEQNRALLLVAGGCLLLLIVVRPTIFDAGPPLARWLGSPWKARYEALELRRNELQAKLDAFYPAGGEGLAETEARVQAGNARLQENFDQYVHALAFIPYAPFLPPRDGAEPGAQFLKVLEEAREALLLYCTLRDVAVERALGFGEFDEGRVPEGKRVPELLRQLAVTDTFVRLCANNQIEFTQIVRHLPRRDVAQQGRKFLREYPVQVKLRAGYRELMNLLNAMNGRRCRVKRAPLNESKGIVEEVTLDIGSADGVQRDQVFTIFKRSGTGPCDLVYAGRVTVTNVRETESEARVEEASLPYDRLDTVNEQKMRIQAGDCASTGFLRVSSIQIQALPGRAEEPDAEGIPTRVIPNMLDVSMEVCTIDFDPRTEYVTVKNADKTAPSRSTGRIGVPVEAGPEPAIRAHRPW